jgi:hypothetical protein
MQAGIAVMGAVWSAINLFRRSTRDIGQRPDRAVQGETVLEGIAEDEAAGAGAVVLTAMSISHQTSAKALPRKS